MKRVWLGLIIVLGFGALASCSGTRALMQTANNIPAKSRTAQPELKFPDLPAWQAARQDIAAQFQTHVYGYIPNKRDGTPGFSNRADVTASKYSEITLTADERAQYGEIRVQSFELSFEAYGLDRTADVIVILPADQTGPVPVIVMQNFCPNHNVIRLENIPLPRRASFDCGGQSVMSDAFTYVFGRHIVSPPLQDILERGYGVAVMHPPEIVPDSAEMAPAALSPLGAANRSYPAGAVMAWALAFDEAAARLTQDASISAIIAYGHSRYGKSALLAGALSPHIDGVIAHQSGTGGASLSRDKPGETIAQITQSYPHWFTPNFGSYAQNQGDLPTDQHMLLALTAPKPVLLGNARRDVWSDPEGAFLAAQAAMPVYKLFGETHMSVSRLDQFRPEENIAYWIRPGTHGVTDEDWAAFLVFMDAHFQ